MRVCPECRSAYPSGASSRCARDGALLIDARELTEQDPLVGVTVLNRFRVHARMASGGMGTIYRATQVGLDRPVALKILKDDLVWDRETVARFHREARAMSLLVHPNTVRVLDFGETEGGLLFLAMELLEGQPLTEAVQERGGLDVLESISIARQILGSLGEAHSKGLIHRDLKPDNIFLARVDGHPGVVVKVLDFGIAKAFRADGRIDQLETQAGTVFGTPRYMSPEQAQGKPLDPRSDLYSVGILLYEMLCGRPPFVDDDAVVVMAKHIREAPQSPRQWVPDRPIPPSLEAAIMCALSKDRERRFPNTETFDGALEACTADQSSFTLRLRPVTVPRSRFSALATPLALAVGIVGAATAGAAFMVFGDDPAPPEPIVSSIDPPPAHVEEASASTRVEPPLPPVGEAPRAAESPVGTPSSWETAPTVIEGPGRVNAIPVVDPVAIPLPPEAMVETPTEPPAPPPPRRRVRRLRRHDAAMTTPPPEESGDGYENWH